MEWATDAEDREAEAAASKTWQRLRDEREALTAIEALEQEEYLEFAGSLRKRMERILTDKALEKGMQRFREVQGVGLGGFKGVWIAKASAASRQRYVTALRGAAADVLAAAHELERARTPSERRSATVAVREAAPRGWTRWLVILLTKPGKPLDVVSKRRDIYLQPHSLKLLMNGFKPAYGEVQRAAQPAANTGFRPGGSAPQAAIILGLMREEAVSERKAWYRGYCDKGGFFQSVVRRVQKAAEARCGVPPDVTSVVMALHETLVVSYDSGTGLTPGTESQVGNGQGDTDGPTRSMEPLAIETRAVEWLVAGGAYRTPKGLDRRRTPQEWFADDGAFGVDSFRMLQVNFTVMSVMARALGFSIGIDTDADGNPTGDKTGWTGAEWDGNKYVEVGDEADVWLIDGRRVPRAEGWYKHLGVRAEAANSWEEARRCVVARCSGMAAALARLGMLTAAEYVETVDTATLTVVAYYGAIFPIGLKACEQIDVAKRRGLARLGHTGSRTARFLVHAQRPEGLGMALTWPHAAAAMVVEVDRAYTASANSPARVAAAARTAKEYWKLGWRPTTEAAVPLAWNPWHVESGLAEEGIIEAALKYRLHAGVATLAAAGDGAACPLAAGYNTPAADATEAASVWEAAGRTFGARLARLGGVQRKHFYGGEETSTDPATGEVRTRGRWRTPAELGEFLGRGGIESGGVRRGGQLTCGEREEYVQLLKELGAEEQEWVRAQRGPPMARPEGARVVAVLAAGKDRRGRREYLLEWSDGTKGWGPRPRSVLPKTAGELKRARDALEATAEEANGGALRGRLRQERGPTWLWLATQAPLAVGR